MTEQPVETEEQFLGNLPRPPRLEDAILRTFAGAPLDDGQRAVLDKAMQHYVPNAHRQPYKQSNLAAIVHTDIAAARLEELAAADAEALPVRVYQDKDQPLPGSDGMDLMLQAENFAHSAVLALSCGELDEAIAWLQSSLAFAQNHRHAARDERAAL